MLEVFVLNGLAGHVGDALGLPIVSGGQEILAFLRRFIFIAAATRDVGALGVDGLLQICDLRLYLLHLVVFRSIGRREISQLSLQIGHLYEVVLERGIIQGRRE